eukprot:9980248-Ditylum_brightwellii.AAC.1
MGGRRGEGNIDLEEDKFDQVSKVFNNMELGDLTLVGGDESDPKDVTSARILLMKRTVKLH